MNVFVSDEQDVAVNLEALRALATHVLGDAGMPPDAEVAVMLLDDATMASYNERFMDTPGPTDVLAFPLLELTPGEPVEIKQGEPPLTLGDVLLCPAEVARRAPSHDAEFEDHLRRLLVHGVLHILGYDHATDADADLMESHEQRLLAGVDR